jgi:hypothetical protein
MAAFITKKCLGWQSFVALRTSELELIAAFKTKFGSLTVIEFAFWAFHD